MLRWFKLISAIFALGVWASASSAAAAGEGHRDYDKGRHYKEKYDRDEYERADDRHDRRREYRHHRERPRYERRYYKQRHRHGGFQKYVFDDGYCRTTYKYRGHGSKYVVRCRDRGYSPRRSDRYERHGAAYIVQPYYVAQTLERAADGQAIVWNDPQKQTRYEVVPTQTYQANNGRYCREFLSTATVGGQTRQVYGKACRQEDGAWEVVR